MVDPTMPWWIGHRFHREACEVADRHYSRRKVGSPQFVAPGRPLVLLTGECGAVWVTLVQRPEFTRHAWPGAWYNAFFRNERPRSLFPDGHLSSDLIRAAVAASRAVLGPPPAVGMVTFIDAAHVRRKRDLGRCYRKAGFRPCGSTADGKLALRLAPDDMPEPAPPLGLLLTMEAA